MPKIKPFTGKYATREEWEKEVLRLSMSGTTLSTIVKMTGSGTNKPILEFLINNK